MTKWLWVLIIIMIAACSKQESTLVTTKVRKGTVESVITLTGRAEASQQSSIMAPEDISIKSLLVTNGEQVKKDQVLCALDTEKLKDELMKEEARLNQLESDMKSSYLKLEGAKKDFERTKRLYSSGAISLTEKEKQAEDIQVQENQIDSKKNDLKIAKSNIEKIKKNMDFYEVKSPFDGTITFIWTPKDNFISGMSVKKGDLLFKISSQGKMQIKTTLREQDIVHFNQGQKLTLVFPALPETTIEGVIKLVDNSATIDKDSGVASFRMYIEFTPPENVKPGMEVEAKYFVNKKENVLMVPRSALNPLSGTEHEIVLVENKQKIKKKIKVGLLGDNDVEVTAGLNLDQEILAQYEETTN